MGSKTTETTVTSPQTQTVTPEILPGQQELLDLQLANQKAISGPQTDLQLQGIDLISQVLAGGALPGSLADISGGIGDIDFGSFGSIDPSEGVLGEEAIADISRKAVGDIQPFFQQQGIIDSGTNLEVSGSIAGDIRRQVAESNLQRQLAIREGNIGRDFAQNQFEASSQFSQEGFNIGNLFNLLNLGVGGQAQVQQPGLTQSSQLARSFAGLQPVTQQSSGGTVTSTEVGPNPFLNSFQETGGSLAAFGAAGFLGGLCWVAREIFGSWEHPKTIAAKFFVQNLAPIWFRKLYLKYGERIAEYISNKPIFKALLRPLFEVFAKIGDYYGRRTTRTT